MINPLARPLERLFSWASKTASQGIDSLPKPVIERALTIIVDELAVAVGGARNLDIDLNNLVASQPKSQHGVWSIATGRRTIEPRWAAFSNAMAANWNELDGGYRKATCHGALYTLPTALAGAEARNLSLGKLVVAFVIGYEIVTRIAEAYRAPLPLKTHPHATLSAIGSASTLAAIQRLPAEDFANVVLAAASMSMVGPFSHAQQGANIRNAWAGVGAHLGFLATDLHQAGIQSSATAFDDVFVTALGHTSNPKFLDEGLTTTYSVMNAYHKKYACCQYLHSSVEAALNIVDSYNGPIKIDEITSIQVAIHPLGAQLDNPSPQTLLAGQFSLPHVVASTLLNGSAKPSTFSREMLTNPKVSRLREQIEISVLEDIEAAPKDRPSHVTLQLTDGRFLSARVDSAIGSPDRPLSHDDLMAKTNSLTQDSYPNFQVMVVELLENPTQAIFWSTREFIDQLTQ